MNPNYPQTCEIAKVEVEIIYLCVYPYNIVYNVTVVDGKYLSNIFISDLSLAYKQSTFLDLRCEIRNSLLGHYLSK